MVLKTLRRDPQTDPRAAAALRREYEFLHSLDVPGIVRVIALDDTGERPVLWLEDAGRDDLSRFARGVPLELDRFFALAIPIAKALGELHRRAILHRDVNQTNIVVDAELRPTLIDFGTATHATALQHAPSGSVLEGTLPYMAPEQTGRMQRPVDHRSDLYALGAVLYELLTGAPPLTADDPAALLHAILVTPPVAPSHVRPELPELLSALVLKLLAKMPEQRYQSAAALAADLEIAERHWTSSAAIPRFELGALDVGGELVFPDALFGRQEQEAELLRALERVRTGGRELVFVRGAAGVGKTALVNALSRRIRAGAWFCAGKRPAEAAPYGAFGVALGQLAQEIAQAPADDASAVRERLSREVGARGRALFEIAPEIEELLGEQPELPRLGPLETENRLHLALLSLLRACASRERPLVVFMDDLQWADPGCSKLLQVIAEAPDLPHLLVIAAYRPTPERDLDSSVLELRSGPTPVLCIELGPLGHAALVAWLSELLACSPRRVDPLARVVLEKTRGDPLFVRRMLQHLHRSQLLVWDSADRSWQWDLPGIERVAMGEDVLELMVSTLRGLPAESRDALGKASCVGGHFDLWLLAQVCGAQIEQMALRLAPALREGLIVAERLRFAPDPVLADASPGFCAGYRFVHDRVQQAASALVTHALADAAHASVARALFAAPSETELERRLFDLVEHGYRGAAQLAARADRLRLSELSHRAGRKAMASAGYGAALALLSRGLELLPEHSFQTHRTLVLRLHVDAAVCAYMAEQPALAERLLAAAFAQTESRFERAELHEAALLALTSKADFPGAIAHGREALAEFGIELPEGAQTPAALMSELQALEENRKGRSIESLLHAPQMRDAEARVSARVLGQLALAAWITDQALVAWIGARVVNLSLQHGNAPPSGLGYAVYGHIRSALYGDIATGHAYAELGIALSRRFGEPAQESRALLALGATLNHWRAPMRTSVAIVREAGAKALDAGDLSFMAASKTVLVMLLLAMGEALSRTLSEVEAARHERSVNRSSASTLLVFRQAIRCLQGRTHGWTRFDDAQFDQQALDAAVATAPTCAATYEVLRLQSAYLFRDLDLAQRMSELAATHLGFLTGLVLAAEYNFYTSLTCAARADIDKAAAPALLARIADNQRQLRTWAESSPENFGHKHTLVAAEVARLEGRPLEACDLYDRAIEDAARAGFVQDEALGHELAGRFRLALGRHRAAMPYLAAARSAYQRWGAHEKARALALEHPSLPEELTWMRAPGSEELGRSALDLQSVTKASEAIASELALESLLDRLMAVCLEIAGAERGALVLDGEGGPALRALAQSGRPAQHQRRALSEAGELVPVSVIEETRRAATVLVLADAAQDPRFAADPYVAEQHVRSVLAVPIVRRATLIGVLYLENNLATHAFTAERARVLQILSAQIAISLSHSQLFENLTREVEERRRAEASLRILVEASAALSESLDYKAILDKVVRMPVPLLAESCAVDVIDEDEQRIERAAVAHVDPAKEALLSELRAMPPRWEAPDPTTRLLQSGEPLVLPELTDEALLAYGVDENAARVIRALGTRTAMSVPLIAHQRIVGVLHLGSGAPGRRYGPADLPLAQELARRGAMAIENARLYRASQEAVQVRDDFLSVASHELRTPLNALHLAVHTFVQRLSRAGHDGDYARRLALIDRQTQRLVRLTEMLLDASRIHAGRLELELEAVDFSAVIHDVAERFAGELARAGCPLRLHVEPSVVGYWDRMRLDQVLTNLLSNAIKFGADQPIDVDLDTRADHVFLRVRDRGIGIPPDLQRVIFERFERGVSARSYGGLGLGLYITRTIVQALGGTIRVESQPGAGSTFIVELPRNEPPAAHRPHDAPESRV